MFGRKLGRAKVVGFFAGQPRCAVALEACAGAHHWGRELQRLGHDVRLIPPAYVKPFVKRQKNDAVDAETICEAAQRPSMRLVAVKSEAQQASALVFRARDLVVRQHTQLANACRSHMAELVDDPASDVPDVARPVPRLMFDMLAGLDRRIAELDREIVRRAREDEAARRLMSVPGIGSVTATAMLALAPSPDVFTRGRDFSAWVELMPRQHSSSGKERLGAITHMGERSLRRLLILGAGAVVRHASHKGAPEGSWLAGMLARKPRMLVTVALANKTARVVWALMRTGESYRAPALAA